MNAEQGALDPHVKGLLAMIAAAGRPKVWQATLAEAREGIIALAQAADLKDVPTGGIDNSQLPGAAGPLACRIYTPLNAAAEPLPAIVYFHGGGFVIGNLDTHDGMCRLLANASGCRLISVEYRLAPEHKLPAAMEDCFAAAKWIAGQCSAFGIDARRIAVAGDSAGGTLAATTSQRAKLAGGPAIALQVLFCPATDGAHDTPSARAFGEGYLLEAESIRWFTRQFCPDSIDPNDPRIAPLHAADLHGLPPAHIHTAEFDPLRDEGRAYGDRLRAAGVPVRYTCHAGMIHHFYALGAAIPYASAALKEAGGAIRAALS